MQNPLDHITIAHILQNEHHATSLQTRLPARPPASNVLRRSCLVLHLDNDLAHMAARVQIVERGRGFIKRKDSVNERGKGYLFLSQKLIQLHEILLGADTNTPGSLIVSGIIVLGNPEKRNKGKEKRIFFYGSGNSLLQLRKLRHQRHDSTWLPVAIETGQKANKRDDTTT